MTDLSPNTFAPEFSLEDVKGKTIQLSDYQGKFVVLALLRGFF